MVSIIQKAKLPMAVASGVKNAPWGMADAILN